MTDKGMTDERMSDKGMTDERMTDEGMAGERMNDKRMTGTDRDMAGFDNRDTETDEERRIRRRARIEVMKREKKKAEIIHRCIYAGGLFFMVLTVFFVVKLVKNGRHTHDEKVPESTTSSEQAYLQQMQQENQIAVGQMQVAADTGSDAPDREVFAATATDAVVGFQDTVISEYGVVIDVEKRTILAQKSPKTRMSPASMTKILTVLTAAEALGITGENWADLPVLSEKVTISREITDYCYVNNCSNVGYEVGEEATVKDLFYGTILPSGADAALGLAIYVSGSQEAFVDLMNRKLEELGMAETSHFTNCAGLYDDDHYSTVYDIAVMLQTAAENPFCRDVLSAHTYVTIPTEQHPEGMILSNWFLRRIEDKETGGEVLCGKTGFVAQSKSCAASLAVGADGREYICVTAGSDSSWTCIYDHAELYRTWIK